MMLEVQTIPDWYTGSVVILIDARCSNIPRLVHWIRKPMQTGLTIKTNLVMDDNDNHLESRR